MRTPEALDLLDREVEVALLDERLARMGDGLGGIVWLEGEAGIGKSALAGVAVAEARLRGWQVFVSAGEPLTQPLPLWVLMDCLQVRSQVAGTGTGDPRRAAVVAALRGSAQRWQPTPVDQLGAARELLLDLVEGLCAAGPTLVVLDDLHWADDATLQVWRRGFDLVDQLPLLLVSASRPDPSRPALADLRAEVTRRGGWVVPVAPLSRIAETELVRRALGAVPGPRLLQLTAAAAGNPFFLHEIMAGIAAGIAAGEALRREGGRVDLSADAMASRVSSSSGGRAIRAGLELADPRQLSWLRVMAVLGTHGDVVELASVLGSSTMDVESALSAGLKSGLIVATDGGWRFRHPLIRDAVYEQTPAALRVALHRQAAVSLAGAGASVATIGGHLLATDDLADDWALDWLAQNAGALAHRAPEAAAELLRRSSANLPAGDLRRQALERAMVTVAFLRADYEQTERRARQILAHTDHPAVFADVTWELAYTFLRLGRYDDGLAAVSDALSRTLDDVWRARMGALRAVILVYAGRDQAADEAATAAGLAATQAGDAVAHGYASYARFLVAYNRRDHQAALGHLDDGLASLGEDPHAAELSLMLLGNRGVVLQSMGRMPEARVAMAESVRLAERASSATLGFNRLVLAAHLFITGNWDDALAELALVDTEISPVAAVRVHGMSAVIFGHRGDRAAAAAHVAAAPSRHELTGHGLRSATFLLLAEAMLAERQTGAAAAYEILTAVLDDEDVVPNHAELLHPRLVRLALAVGDQNTAQIALERMRQANTANATATTQAAVCQCDALLGGEPEPLLAAIDEARKADFPIFLAEALEDAAAVLAGRAALDGAQEALGEAVEIYTALGADWDVRRADARLRALGLRRGVRGPRDRPTRGWAALTPTEQRVAHFVTTGMSNVDIADQLVLSRHTVRTHVSSILAKLGVASRAAIVREMPTPRVAS